MPKNLILQTILRMVTFRMIHFIQPAWSSQTWRLAFDGMLNNLSTDSIGALENNLRGLTNVSYALALNLGRSCIQAALEAYNFPGKSEVILPSFSCSGVIVPVIQAGLIPVFADIDSDFNLSVESVEKAISPRTRAIIFPHLSGKFSRDTLKIIDLAKGRGLKTIEDAAQAFGLRYGDKWAGTFGDVGIYSFGSGKSVDGPGGGALITNDPIVRSYCLGRHLEQQPASSVKRRLRKFLFHYRFQGISKLAQTMGALSKTLGGTKSKRNMADFSFRVFQISGVEAELALQQVNEIQKSIAGRIANSELILKRINLESKGLAAPDPRDHIFTKFIVTTKEPQKAKEIRWRLRAKGIETEISYTPLHLRPPFDEYSNADLPNTESMAAGAFSIPVRANLSAGQEKRLVDALNAL